MRDFYFERFEIQDVSFSYPSLTCCDPDRSGEYRAQSVGGAAVIGCAVDVSPIAVAPAKDEPLIGFGNQPWPWPEQRCSQERTRKGHPTLRGGGAGAVATRREGSGHLGLSGRFTV